MVLYPYGEFSKSRATSGLRTELGTMVPFGARVIYLCSAGVRDGDDSDLSGRLVTTLSSALSYCRSGRGDTIVALPGHSESVTDNTMLTNLVPGTKILGIGHGGNRPVFRWTDTAAQWILDDADVVIAGLRLRLEGANGVVKAIVGTAADNVIRDCDIEVASGATAKATIALEIGTGAHRFFLTGCHFRGTATHNVTDGVKIVGAVDQVRISDCVMSFSATAGNGLIHVTAAATNLNIRDCELYNTHTASTATIALDNVASDGLITRVSSATLNDGVAASQGIVVAGANCLVRCNQCYSVDEKAKSGVLNPGAVAT